MVKAWIVENGKLGPKSREIEKELQQVSLQFATHLVDVNLVERYTMGIGSLLIFISL